MNCESCDRDNVIKAYCYFSHRPEQFCCLCGEPLTLVSFARFAVEMELSLDPEVWCSGISKVQISKYWQHIKPEIKKTLRIQYTESLIINVKN